MYQNCLCSVKDALLMYKSHTEPSNPEGFFCSTVPVGYEDWMLALPAWHPVNHLTVLHIVVKAGQIIDITYYVKVPICSRFISRYDQLGPIAWYDQLDLYRHMTSWVYIVIRPAGCISLYDQLGVFPGNTCSMFVLICLNGYIPTAAGCLSL